MMNYVTLKNPMMMIPFETMYVYNDSHDFTNEEAVMLGEVTTLSGSKFEKVYSSDIPEGDYLIVFMSEKNKMYALASEVHIMSVDGKIMEMKESKPVLQVYADELSENEYNSSEEEYEVIIDGEYYKTVHEISSVDVAVKEYFAEEKNKEEYLDKTKENKGSIDIDVKVKANIIREYDTNVELELESGQYEWEEK